MADHDAATAIRPSKHAAPDSHDPLPAKRAHVQGGHSSNDGDRINGGGAAVTEKEVGIIAYVDPALVPIKGGIIKQRFSDFHVHEVARGGQVCRITSLLPPTVDAGGAGLYEEIREAEAEHADLTGALRAERLAKEAAERKAREVEQQAQRTRVAEQTWQWTFNDEQQAQLRTLVGEDELTALRTLWTQGPPSKGGKNDANGKAFVVSLPIASKEERTAAHQLIRTLFESFLITETVDVRTDEGTQSSALRIRWGTGKPEQRRPNNQTGPQQQQQGGQANAPPYIHFLLQKTNRDSQDALNVLARSLNLLRGAGGNGKSVKELSVSGTKDKRGVTVQQVALRRGRKTIDDVWRMANGIGKASSYDRHAGRRTVLDAVQSRGERGIRIAHLRYSDTPLFLGGSLDGNEFVIVLRNVKVRSRAVVDAAMSVLQSKGFVNYYGMQRFGTSAISTHRVGLALLRDDFAEAVELIMAPREGDPTNVQQARAAYQNGDLDESLALFPHYSVPERSIAMRMRTDKNVSFPSGQRPSSVAGADWKKYFSGLPRTLRSMYVHAYQSYVWNRITTERVQRFGVEKPVVGDFVLLSSGDGAFDYEEATEGNESDGHAMMQQDDEDARANGSTPSIPTHAHARKLVKVLTSEHDVAQYTIHDVVVPMPGSSVQFIEGSWSDAAYRAILAEDGLTHDHLVRAGAKSPELALTGDYRSLLHLPRNVQYELVRYTDPDVNLVQSDEDKILGLDVPSAESVNEVAEEGEQDSTPSFVALVLRLTLGVSAYATMALREVLKQDTSMAHQRELTRRGEDRIAPQYRKE